MDHDISNVAQNDVTITIKQHCVCFVFTNDVGADY